MKNIVKFDRFISVALAAVLIFMLFMAGTSTTMAEPDYEMLGNEFVSYEQTGAGETGSGDAESGDSGSGEAGPGETGSGEGSSEEVGSNENEPAGENEGTGETEDSGEVEDSGDRGQGSGDEGDEDSGSEETEPEDNDEENDNSAEESNSTEEDINNNTEEEADGNSEEETDNNTEEQTDNSTDEEADEETDEEDEESAAIPEIEGSNSISGFFWIDGNGDLETDWDGLYNGFEQPLVGFTVYLYAADDLSTAIDETKTNFVGNYSFTNLAPGSYALGLWGANVDGTEYLAPVFVTDDNKFAIDWSVSGLPAYTEVIELEEGQAVAGINAGMRLPMETTAYRNWDSIKGLNDPALDTKDTVLIDGRRWAIVKKQTIDTGSGTINAVYLLLKGSSYSSQRFSSGSVDYATSELRGRMTKFYSEKGSTGIPTIRSIALVPQFGVFSSFQDVTTPTAVMAGDQIEDIMFAPSFKDMKDWTGGLESGFPKNHQLSRDNTDPGSFAMRFWFRTPSRDYPNSAMSGYFYLNNGFDQGLYAYSASNIGDVPGVWVNASLVTRNITIHYIDTLGNALLPPYTDPMVFGIDEAFPSQWNPVSIPNIAGYGYIEWRKGIDGAGQSISVAPNLAAADVAAGKDIYLVYEKMTADVTVSKTVTGSFSNRQKPFTFTVYLADSGDNPLAAGTTYSLVGGTISGTGATVPQDGELVLKAGGYDTFELRHGQTFTIMDLPRTAKIMIVESAANGYSMLYTDSKYPGALYEFNMVYYETVDDAARSFDYLNIRDYTVPTGLNDGIWAVTALAITATGLLITGMATVRHIKKKYGIRNEIT